jgi:uncharacterized protein
MSDDKILALHKKYAPDERSFDLVFTHCKIVAEIALGTVRKNKLEVDDNLLYTAAMLHDIGAYTMYVPELKTFKKDGYEQHALIGASLLRGEGLPEAVCDIILTHRLMGVTADETKLKQWKTPYVDVVPASLEGELVCFADRFHSKHPSLNDPHKFIEKLATNLPEQAAKYQARLDEWGAPDLEFLAKKYNQVIE